MTWNYQGSFGYRLGRSGRAAIGASYWQRDSTTRLFRDYDNLRFGGTVSVPVHLDSVVLELAQSAQLPIQIRDLSEAETRAADEIWVTSSSKEVLAIVKLDGQPVGDGRPGPVFRRMHQLYQEFKRTVMRAGRERAAA